MKQTLLVAALGAVLAIPAAPLSGQTMPAAGTTLGTVSIPRAVRADGQALAAGTYEIRLSGTMPARVVGQSPDGARYVEFVRGGQVAGREVATVVAGPDVASIAKGGTPASGRSRVDLLAGGDYLRVWINHAGTSYIIHLPPS